jgi:glutamate-ammonia-ligase adenylyltransferase
LRVFREAGLFSVDLRLRPDGGKGLLVRTPAALRYYSNTEMDPWERFALGHARPLDECPDVALVYEVAYAGLSEGDVASLAEMKRRIETERVESQHGSRNVKLGPGGLLDIEWLAHLCEMRYVTAMDVAPGKRFSDRIRSLNGAGLMNALETEVLLQAHRWLLDLRVAIWLQGTDSDVMPENPDKLDRIAEFMGDNNGNATLAKHAETVSMVRKLYEMAWEILAR